MGTRNLTAVYHDGKYKVAQYGQWDGYPSGQGFTILEFLRTMNREHFIERLNAAHWITEDEIAAVNATKDWSKVYPHLSRDAGGEILEMISSSTDPLALQNSIGFAGDSLFCEWAYVVDLDTNKLEVFKGFNKGPLADSERFAKLESLEKQDGYYPVRLVAEFDLAALPDNETFEKTCDPQKEE